MAKNKPTSNRTLIILMACAAAVFGGLVAYVRMAPADKVPESIRRESDRVAQPTPDKARDILVFAPVGEKDGLPTFEATSVSVPKGVDPMVYAVNQFLGRSKIASPQAKLLSVDIHGALADLYFNSAFAETTGSFDEKVLLDGIRRSIGQLSNIDRIGFHADGAPIETLGNVELAEPLSVIRPEPSAQP